MYFNPEARQWRSLKRPDLDRIRDFHQQLPDYAPTRLVSLAEVAKTLGVRSVYLKDESNRFGLPSFKILGASWATFVVLAKRLGLPLDTKLDDLKVALQTRHFALYAATDGNHGRAVAYMGRILHLEVNIYVPRAMDAATMQLIRDEGAAVKQLDASYDDAVLKAANDAHLNDGVFIQDTAFEGYEEIPQWVVEGYSTMMREVDSQLSDGPPDLVVVPVGVGSFAQSVVLHSKSLGRSTAVLTVEPNTAACLHRSLERGEATLIETTYTISAGMDCGTVSSIAEPILCAGVDGSMTVSDYETHLAVEDLASMSIAAGPCGAAPLAALRGLTGEDSRKLGLDETSTIVLLCSEGARDYPIPRGPTDSIVNEQ